MEVSQNHSRLSAEQYLTHHADAEHVRAIARGEMTCDAMSTIVDFCITSKHLQDHYLHLSGQSHELAVTRAKGEMGEDEYTRQSEENRIRQKVYRHVAGTLLRHCPPDWLLGLSDKDLNKHKHTMKEMKTGEFPSLDRSSGSS